MCFFTTMDFHEQERSTGSPQVYGKSIKVDEEYLRSHKFPVSLILTIIWRDLFYKEVTFIIISSACLSVGWMGGWKEIEEDEEKNED